MKIYKYFNLERGKEYPIKLKIYYQDVLQNWYYQTVDITYEATEINNGSYPVGIVNYKVSEELLLNNDEVPKF